MELETGKGEIESVITRYERVCMQLVKCAKGGSTSGEVIEKVGDYQNGNVVVACRPNPRRNNLGRDAPIFLCFEECIVFVEVINASTAPMRYMRHDRSRHSVDEWHQKRLDSEIRLGGGYAAEGAGDALDTLWPLSILADHRSPDLIDLYV